MKDQCPKTLEGWRSSLFIFKLGIVLFKIVALWPLFQGLWQRTNYTQINLNLSKTLSWSGLKWLILLFL